MSHKEATKESLWAHYLRAAVARGSMGTCGVPFDSIAVQMLLESERQAEKFTPKQEK